MASTQCRHDKRRLELLSAFQELFKEKHERQCDIEKNKKSLECLTDILIQDNNLPLWEYDGVKFVKITLDILE